jgi:two-component system, cell cycle sensor histidine kinase DivJ
VFSTWGHGQVLYIPASASEIEARVASLVHHSAASDPELRDRHLRFMLTRLLVGGAMLAVFPIYLAVFGQPSLLEIVAFMFLLLPLASVAILSKSGNYEWAVGVSSLALSGLVVTLALGSGGVKSPIVIWFVAVPLEAMFSGSIKAIRVTMMSAVIGLLSVALLDWQGLALPGSPWSLHIAIPIMALSAISHVVAVGLAIARNDLHRRASAVAQNARDQAVLEAMGDLVTWHDLSGSVTFASQAAEDLLGVQARHLIGRGLFERVQVADRPAYLKAVADAARSDEAITVEMRLHTGRFEAGQWQNGSEVIWVEMKAKLIKSPHEDASQPYASNDAILVCVTRDITQSKNHEQEIEAARADAERASDLKGRFLATVSHELRTPLNAIIGFSEILSTESVMTVDTARRMEYARIIQDSGHHLLEIVNTLLDISKIETGNFDLSPEPFSLCDMISSCCDLMQLKADNGAIRLDRNLPQDFPEIIGDQRAYRQVIINLLSNAVKFTPRQGRITIGVQLDSRKVVITVSDTGIGIAEIDLPRLGDPFFQAKSSYDRPYEGTGLGLSVVRGLVGLHHGSMTIASAPSKGTSVTITVPQDCRIGSNSRLQPIRIETLSMPADRAPNHENAFFARKRA